MSYWYCGHPQAADTLALNLSDPALLYGATLFTTLRVYDQSLDHPLTQWAAHQQRLRHSLDAFSWPQPCWEALGQGAETLAQQFPIVRITLLPPDGQYRSRQGELASREWITGRELPADLAQRQQRGIVAQVVTGEIYGRSHPDHKTGNYLGAWAALQAAKAAGAQEAILTDAEGNWLETSTGNLWGWGQGCWWTPPTAGQILPGVVRSHLLAALTTAGETVQQVPWDSAVIDRLEAVAYSNCGVEVVPCRTILRRNTKLGYGPNHPQIRALQQLYAKA